MLIVSIPSVEAYDEETEQFVSLPGETLHLEHNLLSLSKWEAITHKHLIGNKDVTGEELLKYVECMVQDEEFDPTILNRLPSAELKRINDYISDPMTATQVKDRSTAKDSGEYTSSELIYYWMIACQIPFTCETWHINRLLTLIRVCNAKAEPGKKMSQSEIMSQNRELNRARRKALGTRG